MSKANRHAPPIKVALGWLDTDVKRDAVELAKGHALKHMDAPEITFFAVMPLLDGHLWEVHEGGSGHSYLPSVAEALAKGTEPAWFRVGSKAYTVALRDGRPYCILQPNAESKKLIDGEFPQLKPKGRMNHVLRKGKGVFGFGVSVFASGFLFLAVNVGAYAYLQHTIPEPRALEADMLPHRQWTRVEKTATSLYVDSLRFKDGQWTTSVKPILRTGNPDASAASGDINAKAPADARRQISSPAIASQPASPPSMPIVPASAPHPVPAGAGLPVGPAGPSAMDGRPPPVATVTGTPVPPRPPMPAQPVSPLAAAPVLVPPRPVVPPGIIVPPFPMPGRAGPVQVRPPEQVQPPYPAPVEPHAAGSTGVPRPATGGLATPAPASPATPPPTTTMPPINALGAALPRSVAVPSTPPVPTVATPAVPNPVAGAATSAAPTSPMHPGPSANGAAMGPPPHNDPTTVSPQGPLSVVTPPRAVPAPQPRG